MYLTNGGLTCLAELWIGRLTVLANLLLPEDAKDRLSAILVY